MHFTDAYNAFLVVDSKIRCEAFYTIELFYSQHIRFLFVETLESGFHSCENQLHGFCDEMNLYDKEKFFPTQFLEFMNYIPEIFFNCALVLIESCTFSL